MSNSQTPEAEHEEVDSGQVDAEAFLTEWVDATGVGFEMLRTVRSDRSKWDEGWRDVDLSETVTQGRAALSDDTDSEGAERGSGRSTDVSAPSEGGRSGAARSGTEGAAVEGAEPATLLSLDSQRELRERLTKFLMPYKFAIDEVMTKIKILQEEFTHTGEYNPIEHVSARLKDLDSIVEKMEVRGIAGDFDQVRETITDIAGVRVVCSFISDVYRVFELLTAQRDVRVHTVKDYIANPKPNGYRSLHLILELPVYLSSGAVNTLVEVQIRTIAMDFWASLEHKIYYKYDREVPEGLLQGLKDAAAQAGQLDASMEWLHIAIRGGERSTLVRRSADALLASERDVEAERGEGEDPGAR